MARLARMMTGVVDAYWLSGESMAEANGPDTQERFFAKNFAYIIFAIITDFRWAFFNSQILVELTDFGSFCTNFVAYL